jgi:hypothetical protein
MKQEYNNDQNLVNFLKQNQPFPSSSTPEQEKRLMARICSPKIRCSRGKNPCLLLFFLGSALGLLLIWANWSKNKILPQIAHEEDNVEKFMINAWKGSMAIQIENNQFQYLEQDWLFGTRNNEVNSHP